MDGWSQQKSTSNEPASSVSLFKKSRGVLPAVFMAVRTFTLLRAFSQPPSLSTNLRPADEPIGGHLIKDLHLLVCQVLSFFTHQACESKYEFSQLRVGGSVAERFCGTESAAFGGRWFCVWRALELKLGLRSSPSSVAGERRDHQY